MNQFEKEVIDRLGRIETKLDNDFHTIHGNGQPGLVQKVEALDSRVQGIEDQHKQESKHLGTVAGVAGFLISIAVAIYSAFKNS